MQNACIARRLYDHDRKHWNARTAIDGSIGLAILVSAFTINLFHSISSHCTTGNNIIFAFCFNLQVAYTEKGTTYSFVKKLMALPFIPHEYIPDVFTELSRQTENQQLLELIHYIRNTWIESTVWPPASWSVFNLATRTNNDVEGWHHRLNDRAERGQLSLYLLVPLLHQEAEMLPLQIKLVSEKKMKRYQRKDVRTRQARINNLWGAFVDNEISVKQLLKRCSRLNGPHIEAWTINWQWL